MHEHHFKLLFYQTDTDLIRVKHLYVSFKYICILFSLWHNVTCKRFANKSLQTYSIEEKKTHLLFCILKTDKS